MSILLLPACLHTIAWTEEAATPEVDSNMLLEYSMIESQAGLDVAWLDRNHWSIDHAVIVYIKQIGCFHVWCRAIWLDLEWAPIWVVTWTVMVDRSAWRHMLHNVNSLWAVSTKCKRWKSSNLYRGSELRRASAIDCFNHWNHSWFTVALTLAAVCYR
jgi:hypothetical protein